MNSIVIPKGVFLSGLNHSIYREDRITPLLNEMSRYCNKCGVPVVDDQALFCNKCGSKIPEEQRKLLPICKKCGTPVVDNQSMFCNKCGSSIKKSTSETIQIVDTSKKYTHLPLVADETKDKSSFHDEKISFNKPKPVPKRGFFSTKQIQETRCTCSSCGNVWHYGKREAFQNAGNALSNATKDLYACSCCFPLFFLKGKDVKDMNKCPSCGSSAIRKEQITHDVE